MAKKKVTIYKLRRLLHLGIDLDAAPETGRLIRSLPPRIQNHAPGASDDVASRLQLYRPDFPRFGGFAGLGRLSRMARAMRGYDLVVTHGEGALQAVRAHSFFGPSLKLPPLLHFHHAITGFTGGPSRNFAHRLAFARTSAIVVPTQETAREFAAKWQPPSGSLHILPPLYPPPPRQKPAADAMPRLVKRKDEAWIGARAAALAPFAGDLIGALATLPPQWRLVVFGDKSATAPFDRQAEAQGVSDRLLLSDRLAGPAPFAGLFDIILARSDGAMPADLAEAQAAGVASIVSGPPALAALLPASAPAMQTGGSDGDSLQKALVALAQDEGARREAGEANRAFAHEHADAGAHHALIASLLDLPALA